MSTKHDDYLDAGALREALGISEATYYRWLREGRLKGVKVGRRWRFPPAVVDALREDPERSHERRAGLERAVEACTALLGRAGVKRKAVDALRKEADGDGEAVARMLLHHALARRAGDLHLDPVAEGLAVRERVHGVLRPVAPPLPHGARDGVVTAFKRMAGFDLTVTTRPQDARFLHAFEGRQANVWLTSYPTELGEALTLRILDPATVSLSFETSGFGPRLREAVREAIRPGRGVFLINGPTGCGKTTTAYALLSELNRPGVKVMTVEDPVEFLIDGVLQAPLKPPMTFATAMRAMLRSDVDVAYVGELRDAETIRLLFQMGGTGHKVISCLHARDAVGALGRILDVADLPPQQVAESLLGVLSQRLVPLACPDCRRMAPMPREAARRLGAEPFPTAACEGCEACDGSGVRGRTAVGELLVVGEGLRRALLAGERDPEALRRALPADWRDLRADVLERLRAGEIPLEHALAVLDL